MTVTGAPSHGAEDARGTYDYVLAAGPGRSGTTFLYRHLNAHPGFMAPEIKEAHYYRSARRLDRALGIAHGAGAALLDVADTAWSDPRLDSVSRLVRNRLSVLIVVLLRRHRDRARSVMGYRRSRVLPAIPALLAGRGGLERAAVLDSLTPEALERIFALGADVLVVEFEALAVDPGRVLDALAGLCGTHPFGQADAAAVNPAEAARSAPLAAAAKLAAWTLRGLGARRLLQALKDEPRLVRLVFRPARPEELPELSETAAACLDERQAACRAAVEAACAQVGAGLWFARGAPVPARDRERRRALRRDG